MENILSNFDDLRVLVLFYWAEGFLLAYTGPRLLGIKTPVGKAILIGFIHGCLVFLVRGLYKSFGIPFGTHAVLLIFLLSLQLTFFTGIRWGISVTASMLGLLLLMLGEMVTMPYFYKALDMPVEQIWANPWTHILAGYVGDSLVILAALVTTFTNASLLKIRQ